MGNQIENVEMDDIYDPNNTDDDSRNESDDFISDPDSEAGPDKGIQDVEYFNFYNFLFLLQ